MLIALAAGGAVTGCAAVEASEVAGRLAKMPAAHPRLFLAHGAEANLTQQIAANPLMGRLRADLLAEADRELRSEPVKQEKIGRRLLD